MVVEPIFCSKPAVNANNGGFYCFVGPNSGYFFADVPY